MNHRGKGIGLGDVGMVRKAIAVLFLVCSLTEAGWAGARATSVAAPVLSEVGLIGLGLALAGAGVALLRRRR